MQYQTTGAASGNDAANIYTFKREDGRWYIYLPAFLNRGYSRLDLEMTEGAHKLLNYLSRGANKIRLWLAREPIANGDTLELMELCEAPKGGGIYLYSPQNNTSNWNVFWICDLALLVFGDLPQRIYLQRLSAKTKDNATIGLQGQSSAKKRA